MKRSMIIGVVALVVVVAGVVWLMSKNSPSYKTTTTNTTNSSTAAAATVTYDANGFSPAQTTIKSGDAVTFTNKTSDEIQVDSDPHPVHTDDTDLNVGPIGPGQSKTVTLTKKGSFGFHNHLDPSDTAHITIQ